MVAVRVLVVRVGIVIDSEEGHDPFRGASATA
jgi:hypothetical protein